MGGEGENKTFSSISSRASREYPCKLTRDIILTCFAAATEGAMFGYAIGVTGGVTSMAPFLKRIFPGVYRQQEELDQSTTNQYCKFNNQLLTLFTSSQYITAIIASLVPSNMNLGNGRKAIIGPGGYMCIAGAVLNSSSGGNLTSIAGQILFGFGLGFLNQCVPIYLSEMAPYKYRVPLNVMFQLSTTLGILFANVINYFTVDIHGGWGWRISLGLLVVPAAILVYSWFVLPETPTLFIEHGNGEAAKLMLKRIRGVDDVETEFEDMVAASEELKRVEEAPWTNLLSNRFYRPQLCLVALIPFFQQMTGINVVMFYAPELFRMVGFSSSSSLLSSIIIGVVNIFATLIALVFCVDRFGRKQLFMIGGVIMLVSQVVVAVLIGAKLGTSGVLSDPLSTLYAMLVVVCICVFVAAFAFSWGPLGLLVPFEISPLEIRSAAQRLTVSVNMFFMFGIGQLSLSLLCAMKFWFFVFFALFVLVMTGFMLFLVPETKNIPIDEISEIWKSHWFWKRYTNEGRSKGAKVCSEV